MFLFLVSAGVFCLAMASLARKPVSVARVTLALGLFLLGADALFSGLVLRATTADQALFWQRWDFAIKALIPGVWLAFSLAYSRGNYQQFLRNWRLGLAGAFLVPLVLCLFTVPITLVSNPSGAGNWFHLTSTGRVFAGVRLLVAVLILTNLEKTFRLTIGVMRWRVKFVLLGVGVMFGARIYAASQNLLFLVYDQNLAVFEGLATVLGGALIGVAYLRAGFAEADVYPSRSILQGSITVIIAGGYLLIVGVLAQVVAMLGGVRHFQAQAFLVLLGLVGLAIILLSDRFRQRLQDFVTRHFRRPRHDFEKVWTQLTERLSTGPHEHRIATEAARLISETFNILTVRIWLVNAELDELVLAASTSDKENPQGGIQRLVAGLLDFRSLTKPTDLEKLDLPGVRDLKEANNAIFPHGGHRVVVPLNSGQQWLGLAVLADRVQGIPYTLEEFELLRCIGDQVAAGLLNLRLSGEIMRAKELEAFQSLSAFFVHDLKNAASTLNLTLQNLPTHFDDPAYRADALRGISSTVNRINSVTTKLSSLRGPLAIVRSEVDPNELIVEIAKDFERDPAVVVTKRLNPIPKIHADREQLRSVLTNLLLNARDAVSKSGEIAIESTQSDGRIILSVTDSGCGMTPDFVRTSLFRPFQTTKAGGIGIGMFQSKVIVEAHGGIIQVVSAPEQGSTFRVILPIGATGS